MSLRIHLSLYIVVGLSLLTNHAFAAPKPKFIPIDEAFSVTTPGGKSLTCYEDKKGKFHPGSGKGKKFKPDKDSLKKKQEKKKTLSNEGKSVKKIAQQIKEMKAELKENALLCQNGTKSKAPIGSASMDPLDRAMTEEDVRYLFEKAGFGLSPSEKSFFVPIGVNQGVGALVNSFMETRSEDSGVAEKVADYLDNQLNVSTTQSPAGQRSGLMYHWAKTNNPYAERFALFLLGVWTVSGDVISDETFRHEWWDYYFTLLRGAAQGDADVKVLAKEITRNPLMSIYLNNNLNKKNNLNENYARELMELFTLGPTNLEGEANYTETQPDGSGDIANAAKMLTGRKVTLNYSINQMIESADPANHEPGTFTMFAGKPWAFSGEDDEDLVNGIFDNHPEVKHYYAKEILKDYVTPSPSAELIKAFGAVIKSNGYRLRPSMAVLFKSKAFYDEAYRNTVPKSAAEFTVELIRTLELEDAFNPNETQKIVATLGQEVNMAPSVFWYPQDAWLAPSAMLTKANLFTALTGDTTAMALPDPDWTIAKILPVGAATPADVINFAANRLGVGEVDEDIVVQISDYMNKEKMWNSTIVSHPYDNTNLTLQKQKGSGAYYILLAMPEFSLR